MQDHLVVQCVHPAGGLPSGTADSILGSAVAKLLDPEQRSTRIAASGRLDSRATSHGIARDSAFAASEQPARTVVIAGGQLLVRAARHSVLARSGIDVVADVGDAPTAADAAELYRAGVVLVDAEVPGGPVRAVRRIVERAPDVAVLVIAPVLDREQLLATVQAGAKGFLLETLGAGGLIRAVQVALAGESVIPRAGVSTLIEEVRGGSGAEQTSVDGFELQLTRREADVFARLREGMTPKQIAYELGLSAVTVRRHLSSVARKARQARPLTLALESTS
jgi:two-component system, NarL family, response regulator DevR